MCGTAERPPDGPVRGRDLGLFESEMFDGVYAVDTFPYLCSAGPEVVTKHFRETARVLKTTGNFIL
jgi:hypothetical protein